MHTFKTAQFSSVGLPIGLIVHIYAYLLKLLLHHRDRYSE